MGTTRRNFIKMALAGIAALFTARFSKPGVAEMQTGSTPLNKERAYNARAPFRLQREGGVSSEEYPTVNIVWNENTLII